jgi:hypothetical protein
MFDRVYDFFYGEQLRKHVVLISAFVFGQIFVIPLLGWLDSSQHVSLALAVAIISVWPLRLLYDKCFTSPQERTEEQIERNTNDMIMIAEMIRHLERTLYDMYSRRNNKLPTEQKTSDIIQDFIKSRTLSRKFLQDYETLRGHVFHGFSTLPGQTSSLDSARDLLNRLHSISYANKKTIHELSLHFERVLTQNLFALKESGVSDEEIGIMVVNLQSYLRMIMDMSNKETHRLIVEYMENKT